MQRRLLNNLAVWGKTNILKIWIVLAILLIGFCAFRFTRVGLVGLVSTADVDSASEGQSPDPITLKQAWDIIDQQMKQVDQNAQMIALGSVDDADETVQSGQDGKRRAWQAIAASTTEEWWITVVDGKITAMTQGPKAYGDLPPLQKPDVDSPAALVMAQKIKPMFTPEMDLGMGFHFNLRYIENNEAMLPPPLAITITGAYHRRPSFVSINAESGVLEQAKNQMFGGGGILYSPDAGETWQPSNLKDIFVTKVARDLWVENRAYAAATKGGRILVFQTEDGGQNWKMWGTLPPNAEDWPFAIEVVGSDEDSRTVMVGTWSGLWASTDGLNWSVVENLPSGPKQWIGQARLGEKYRVLVSISAGSEQGCYASTDLIHWEKRSERVYRLSESYDRRAVLAVDDLFQDPESILKIDTQESLPLSIPGDSILFAAGDFDGPMLIKSGSRGVGKFDPKQEATWNGSLNASSMDVSTEFDRDQRGVIGSFRAGIYYTADGGKSWVQSLADPNLLIQGTNEMMDVKSLSEKSVVVVNAGKLIWEDF